MPPRIALACLTIAAATLATPAAAAGPPQGMGCWSVIVNDPDSTWQGLMYAGPLAAPGSAVEVTCEIVEWGTGRVLATATTGPQQDVAVLLEPVSFPNDAIGELFCETVTVDGEGWQQAADGVTWTPGGRVCREGIDVPPPPDHCMAIDCGPWGFVDPLICTVLQTLPDVPGVVETADEDLWVAGSLYWDCPPYEVWDA